ncbi:MAG: adenylate/guanylate cyclase domain-containing protein [Bdellovibrionota bacterium]
MAFKFRHKVLFALSAAVLLALGALLAITLWRLQSAAEQRVRIGLIAAQDAFYRSRESQAAAVGDAVESLASTNPELRAVLASRNRSGSDPFAKAGAAHGDDLQTLESSLPFLPLYQHSAEFAVADAAGKLLLVKDRSLLPSDEIPLAALEALKGAPAYDWWHANGKTYQIFASPVVVQSEVVGAVLVGYPVDSSFLGPLARISRTEIEIEPAGAEKSDGEMHEINRNGVRYLGSVVPIKAPGGRAVGAFLVSRSMDEELSGARELRNQLLLIGAAVLLVAVFLALYLANLVSRPLETLGRAVREVGSGNFGFRVRSASRDEFGNLGNLIDEMAAGLQERERIRATFSRYVDDSVVNEVLKTGGAEALQGQEKDITILFADLANFTAFSEGKSPKDLLRDLNEYFASVAGAVELHNGIVDKFIGDAVMAYWGAPVNDLAHPEHACRTALEMAQRFRAEFTPRYPSLGLRIGLATGTALVGNVGSENRQNFTVMGDTVNLASRLEGVNKSFGTVICIANATANAVKDKFVVRYLGRVRVAGRTEPEKIFELVAESGKAGHKLEAIETYEKCVPLFEDGDLPAVSELLRPFADSGDGPSIAMLKRCMDKRRQDRRNGEWDGVWILGK